MVQVLGKQQKWASCVIRVHC